MWCSRCTYAGHMRERKIYGNLSCDLLDQGKTPTGMVPVELCLNSPDPVCFSPGSRWDRNKKKKIFIRKMSRTNQNFRHLMSWKHFFCLNSLDHFCRSRSRVRVCLGECTSTVDQLNISLTRHSCVLDQCCHYCTMIKEPVRLSF